MVSINSITNQGGLTQKEFELFGKIADGLLDKISRFAPSNFFMEVSLKDRETKNQKLTSEVHLNNEYFVSSSEDKEVAKAMTEVLSSLEAQVATYQDKKARRHRKGDSNNSVEEATVVLEPFMAKLHGVGEPILVNLASLFETLHTEESRRELLEDILLAAEVDELLFVLDELVSAGELTEKEIEPVTKVECDGALPDEKGRIELESWFRRNFPEK